MTFKPLKNLTGKHFGFLKVLNISHKKGHRYFYNCECKCGTIKTFRQDYLSNGARTCGCRTGVSYEDKFKVNKENRKLHYLKNRENILQYKKKQRRTIKYRFKRAKESAFLRGLDFNISFEEYSNIASKPCHYCNGLLGTVETRGGLDRKDNNLGYISNNIVSCCQKCNRSKGSVFTYVEFKEMMNTFLSIRQEVGFVPGAGPVGRQ